MIASRTNGDLVLDRLHESLVRDAAWVHGALPSVRQRTMCENAGGSRGGRCDGAQTRGERGTHAASRRAQMNPIADTTFQEDIDSIKSRIVDAEAERNGWRMA